MGFWDFVWLILWTFLLLSYLTVLFQIIIDLFRDNELGGISKALWLIFLIALPLLTALVYVIVRGGGMARRQNARIHQAQSEANQYIRSVAGKSPAAEIVEAKALLDSGVLSQAEYEKLKAKALS